jgi:hypothetical protein
MTLGFSEKSLGYGISPCVYTKNILYKYFELDGEVAFDAITEKTQWDLQGLDADSWPDMSCIPVTQLGVCAGEAFAMPMIGGITLAIGSVYVDLPTSRAVFDQQVALHSSSASSGHPGIDVD